MKYLKTYENRVMEIEYCKKVCWYILGDKNTIINILTKTIDACRITYNKYWLNLEITIDNIKKDKNIENSIGIVLFSYSQKYNTPNIFYLPINSLDSADDTIKSKGYQLLGELKIENDKVVLDKLMVYTKKYNL